MALILNVSLVYRTLCQLARPRALVVPPPPAPRGQASINLGLNDHAAFDQLPIGRLIELLAARASCHMTQAVAALQSAQHLGQTTAWVQAKGGSLCPPDLADSGIDLAALIVVHVPKRARHAVLAKAAEILLRSGGFGMVVVDLWGVPPDRETAWQGRLLGMAREHNSWVLLIGAPGSNRHTSLGPLVSLRLAGERRRLDPGRFAVTPLVHKDKSGCLSSAH